MVFAANNTEITQQTQHGKNIKWNKCGLPGKQHV